MTSERRILIDPQGAILGRGLKVGAIDGLQRASNQSRRVFESWRGHRNDHRLPRLSEVFPGDLGDLVPSMMVVDVLDEPRDYRYRIVGALAAEARRDDPTGKTVREIYSGEVLEFCLENYNFARDSLWGIIDFSIEASANPLYLELETLFLPLSGEDRGDGRGDGRRVDQILVYNHFVVRAGER